MQPYLQKTFYRPFALVTWAFFINAFGGIMVLQVFAVVILEELGTPINKLSYAIGLFTLVMISLNI